MPTQERQRQTIEIAFESGERATLPLSPAFVERIRDIVTDPAAGYADFIDFFYAALRAEVDRAEKGLYARGRRRS